MYYGYEQQSEYKIGSGRDILMGAFILRLDPLERF
jgi:hypothetical protein